MSVLGSVWGRVSTWYNKWPSPCRWIPVVGWMAVIFALSAQPHLPSAPSVFWDAILKKASHMLEYAVLAALTWLALGKRAPLLAWSLAAAYAVSDEYHQSFVPGRQADPLDVLLDVTGAALAVLLLRWGTSRRCVSQQARRRDAAP